MKNMLQDSYKVSHSPIDINSTIENLRHAKMSD